MQSCEPSRFRARTSVMVAVSSGTVNVVETIRVTTSAGGVLVLVSVSGVKVSVLRVAAEAGSVVRRVWCMSERIDARPHRIASLYGTVLWRRKYSPVAYCVMTSVSVFSKVVVSTLS